MDSVYPQPNPPQTTSQTVYQNSVPQVPSQPFSPAPQPVNQPQPPTQNQAFESHHFTLDKIAKNIDIKISQKETQTKFAWFFGIIFLMLVGFSLTIPFITNIFYPHSFNDPVNSAKELLTTLGSILAGPFGFILGFYFKQKVLLQIAKTTPKGRHVYESIYQDTKQMPENRKPATYLHQRCSPLGNHTHT